MPKGEIMTGTMKGAFLPGNSTVIFKDVPIPQPGHGQVLLKMKCCTICGSDIRCIYREHVGVGAEGYQNVIAGHEPCGLVVEEGPGVRRFHKGTRAIVYHISGCGVCHDCRMGYMISCSSPLRAAYGWQRDGGMAEYLLADEKDLVELPPQLSYADGAQVACGFGTVYEAIEKIGLSGDDNFLVTGLGPVGLAACMLGRHMGATHIYGVELNEGRRNLAKKLGLVDEAFNSDEDSVKKILDITNGKGCEKALDASANDSARQIAIRGTRQWGKIVFVGEGHDVHFEPSPDIMHPQKTIMGSWVTSIWKMEDLVERLVRWDCHPEKLITDRFPLDKADDAYRLFASGKCGKVAVCFDEELK
jgi:threonine dehydrogenase-like Zn-dependent dehydrogenase